MFETIVAQAIMDSIKDKIDLFTVISSTNGQVDGSSVMHTGSLNQIRIHDAQIQTPSSGAHILADSSASTAAPKGCPSSLGCPGNYTSASAEWHCCPPIDPAANASGSASLSGAEFWKGTWNPEFRWNPLVSRQLIHSDKEERQFLHDFKQFSHPAYVVSKYLNALVRRRRIPAHRATHQTSPHLHPQSKLPLPSNTMHPCWRTQHPRRTRCRGPASRSPPTLPAPRPHGQAGPHRPPPLPAPVPRPPRPPRLRPRSSSSPAAHPSLSSSIHSWRATQRTP